MRLATIKLDNKEQAAIVTPNGLVPISVVNRTKGTTWKTTLYQMICAEEIPLLTDWYNDAGKEELSKMEAIPTDEVIYAPLYRNPPRIFGIGLNYKDHASDLGEGAPVGFPGSFYKPASCIAGRGIQSVSLPCRKLKRLLAKQNLELSGKECKFIEEADWQDYIVGYTTILDMTEESILRLNPRYLTLTKGFDTFFTFGPQMVTPDEVPDVSKLEVQTVHNGKVHAANTGIQHDPYSTPPCVTDLAYAGWYP